MSSQAPKRRRLRLAVLAGAAVAALVLAIVAVGGEEGDSVAVAGQPVAMAHEHVSGAAASPQIHTEAAHAFQDAMRKLWEDHVTWTRLAIVSFVNDLPDLKATVARLLRNQGDIGDAVKPFYGDEAGEALTKLLEEHINGAVAVLAAAKVGEKRKLRKASRAWYRNGREIADFLNTANPDNWPRGEMRSMMKEHLDQTLDEAVHYLEGRHRASVRDYDKVVDHILEMADVLSDGIIAQFPARFE